MTKKQIEAKKAYDTKYHKTTRAKKYRADLNKERRKRGIYGKGGGDLAHQSNGSLKLESKKKNRANNRPKKRATKA